MSKTQRPVRVRFTRDGAWPKTAEVVISSPDKVPVEAEILHYEDGEPYEGPQSGKAAKGAAAGAKRTGDRTVDKRARDAAAKREKRAAAKRAEQDRLADAPTGSPLDPEEVATPAEPGA